MFGWPEQLRRQFQSGSGDRHAGPGRLAELAARELSALPQALYCHENQLLYPDAHRGERDLHFALTNLLGGAAADAVWFNSAWHRDALLTAAAELAWRLPGPELRDLPDVIADRATVLPPGHDLPPPSRQSHGRPLHLLWAARWGPHGGGRTVGAARWGPHGGGRTVGTARWEADKDPDSFCVAIDALSASGAEFRLSVVGGDAERAPERLRQLRADHGEHRVAWGHQEPGTYRELLAAADVFVSTARHEFFGIAAVEAAAAGACPLLPRRLAYPEVFAALPHTCFHPGDPTALADRLAAWCAEGPPLARIPHGISSRKGAACCQYRASRPRRTGA